MDFAIMQKIPPSAIFIPSLSPTLYYSTKFISKITLILDMRLLQYFFPSLTNFKNQSISTFVLYKVKLVVNSRQAEILAIS